MFIGMHIGLTFAFGYLVGKYFNLGIKETNRLAILASIFGILLDLDYFIQIISGPNVHLKMLSLKNFERINQL